jgi:hypothetical protein
MKIIIQNGGNHALSRAVMERVLGECPSSWRSAVAELAICVSSVSPTIWAAIQSVIAQQRAAGDSRNPRA